MKVSVIIATYNRARTLPRSVQSVLAQTWHDLEVIIVDDGSTDETLAVVDVLKKSDDRITVISFEKNVGATRARNRGLDSATGDFIMVWDSDDILYPEAIAVTMKIFQEHRDVGVVSAPCRQLLRSEIVPYPSRPAGYLTLGQIISKYVPNNEKVRVVRSEYFATVRYHARNIDFMVNGYLARQTKWYHVAEELGDLYLVSDGISLTLERKVFKPTRSIERVPYLRQYLTDFKDDLMEHAPYRLGALSYGVSIGLLLMQEKRQAIKYAWQAVRFDWSLKHALWLILILLPGSGYVLRWYTGAT
jgi:glycosyltransferase involved in cell wall biosynthesis